jgi:hypothetical protein
LRGVGVFAAGLNIENVAGVFGDCGKPTMAGDEFFEIVGIGDALEGRKFLGGLLGYGLGRRRAHVARMVRL